MDEDLAKLDLEDAKISIEIKSTFEPCIICKREILARKELYKADVTVIASSARNNEEFEVIVENLK